MNGAGPRKTEVTPVRPCSPPSASVSLDGRRRSEAARIWCEMRWLTLSERDRPEVHPGHPSRKSRAEDALPDVSGEEQRLRTSASHGCHDVRLGHVDVLGLVHQNVSAWLILTLAADARGPVVRVAGAVEAVEREAGAFAIGLSKAATLATSRSGPVRRSRALVKDWAMRTVMACASASPSESRPCARAANAEVR